MGINMSEEAEFVRVLEKVKLMPVMCRVDY